MSTRAAVFVRLSLALVVVAFATMLARAQGFAAHPASENYKTADGLAVYLGVIPAAMIRGHPKDHPEQSMHEGVPRGTHDYHVTVAIFHAPSGARIEDAEVDATVSPLGLSGMTKRLEPMAIAGAGAYG